MSDDEYSFARYSFSKLMSENKEVRLELNEGIEPKNPKGKIIEVAYDYIRMDTYPNIRIAMDCIVLTE